MIKSHLKIIVLKILEDKELSGYDLVKEIYAFTHNWKPSFGSIYPLLKELYNNKLVDIIKEDRRKIYSITKKGREALKEVMKTKEQIFQIALNNIKNLELVCEKKEVDMIHQWHLAMSNNFFTFKTISKEVQLLSEEVLRLSASNNLKNQEKKIKKILEEAISKLRSIK